MDATTILLHALKMEEEERQYICIQRFLGTAFSSDPLYLLFPAGRGSYSKGSHFGVWLKGLTHPSPFSHLFYIFPGGDAIEVTAATELLGE